MSERRHIGVFGATLVGLSGIIGGGLLVLAGAAFGTAGPSATLGLLLDGGIAWLTAMSLAEISTSFPESGGAYTFAKKVLSVRAAFGVGWVLWFAYIVAGVLYALGFAGFTVQLLRSVCDALGLQSGWLGGRNVVLLFASAATGLYSLGLVRAREGGGGQVTLAKIVLFLVLIACGVLAVLRAPLSNAAHALQPFFGGGASGLLTAMGLTFISLQGFEMISGIAGEIREPARTIPRATFLSLAIAIAIYVPLMFLISTAGSGEHSIVALARIDPDTAVATEARNLFGAAGYWFVVIAIILAMLSALEANLLTASRIAFAMARDRTLPAVLDRTHPEHGSPVVSIYATALAVVAIAFMIPDLTSAGAASSLIFLLAFALTHVTAYLARRRGGESGYRTPLFPAVPILGGLACTALAAFQTVVVPDAGGILLIWLGLGVMLYLSLFKGRAEVADASAEALDPRLQKLRGRTPLVLLPIANPKNARTMVEVANALAPTEFARVLLLAIVRAPRGGAGDPLAQLTDAQDAVRQALAASYVDGHAPEALITAAAEPWQEIRRIADEHRCEALLLGLPRADSFETGPLEDLLREVDCDVAVMRAPDDWSLSSARRVLVPVRVGGDPDELRARLLGTLCRGAPREIVFLTVVPTSASAETVAAVTRNIASLADMNIPSRPVVEVVRSDDAPAAIVAEAARCDLLVLGLRSAREGGPRLASFHRRVAVDAPCAIMLLASRA